MGLVRAIFTGPHFAMASPRLQPFCLILVLMMGGCGPEEDAQPSAPPTVGSPAPEYAATALDGSPFALADLRGKVVLLNVWATWCAPCVREMPGLQALHADYETDGLVVLGTSIDRGSAEDDVRRFIEEHGITFRILLDPDGTIETRFRTLGVPESFLIDRKGILKRRWIGQFDPNAPDTRAEFEALLAEVVS